MEIVNANSASLCNYEVFQLLQVLKDNNQKKYKKEGSLATVTYETLRYLQETECKQQDEDKIKSLLIALQPFKLTKTEKLMILNTPPKSPLEIQLIVQESEERLSESQVDEIIRIVAKYLTVEEQK